MNVKFRLGRSLLNEVRADLSRPHPFAAERVGFLYGQFVDAGGPLVLLTDYEPLADERYINDPYAGARIDSQAIRSAMQGVLDRKQGAFHVHMHHWPGYPAMSRMDAEEIPRVVTGLRRVGPTLAHGILLLHDVECAAWIWLPGKENAVEAALVSVVGFPFHISWRPAA
ncbi:MAG: hypothetical protein U0798_19360 [Gemmataceae bacterium]